MKSTQLLSVVFSLIMFTGVTAGSAAFAESNDGDYNLDDRLENFCNMSDEEKRQFFADHPRLAQLEDRLTNFCDLSEDERDATVDDFVAEHRDEFRAAHEGDMKDKLTRYCEMSDVDKKTFIAEHDKAEDHVERMNEYCSLDEDGRTDFIAEHRDEYKAHMKDKMMDKPHLNYDRLCNLAESDRAAEIDDSEKLDRISEWCEMTPEERKEYKMKNHYGMDRPHDFDRMSDVAKDKLASKMKMSDMSDRLKAMITDKRDISDERRDEIKMKFKEKHGDLTDKAKSELKIKFKNHMASMKVSMSEDRRSSIHDRVAEMKAFKADLHERASEMTDEEKQNLREDFIAQAKDMQLAWITPRTQITAGVDAADVECREGFSLVMKASNGVPMCLKADTALKMIDRGIVIVPTS